MAQKAIHAPFVAYKGNPFLVGKEAFHYEPNGLVIIENGLIVAAGRYGDLAPLLPEGTPIDVYDSDHVLIAGFLDTHVHMPQIQMTAAYGEDLLGWLNTYTFPTEKMFADKDHARRVSQEFLGNLLKAGTTTAMVYCTVFPQSVDAFFEEAEALGLRMNAGKVMMDRNAPDFLLDTPTRGYEESKALGEKWHNRGRLGYVITPRFAPTSTPEQLEAAGALRAEHPEWFVQSHLSENLGEIEWVKALFPEREGYYDVYDHYGLVGPRSVYGHCVHLTEKETDDLHSAGTGISHCPTSNQFLGSGLFPLRDGLYKGEAVRVGLGTDLGAGTSFSELQSLNEAYKVQMLQGSNILDAEHAYYLATAGSAFSIYQDDLIGNIHPGLEADLVVLDTCNTEYLKFRMGYAQSIEERLFTLMTMGDDRAVAATYVGGDLLYSRSRGEYEGKFHGRAAHLNALSGK